MTAADSTTPPTGAEPFASLAARTAYELACDEGTRTWDELDADQRQDGIDHFEVVLAAVQPQIEAAAVKRAEDRIVEWLEERGIVGPAIGSHAREVLAAPADLPRVLTGLTGESDGGPAYVYPPAPARPGDSGFVGEIPTVELVADTAEAAGVAPSLGEAGSNVGAADTGEAAPGPALCVVGPCPRCGNSVTGVLAAGEPWPKHYQRTVAQGCSHWGGQYPIEAALVQPTDLPGVFARAGLGRTAPNPAAASPGTAADSQGEAL